MWPLQEALDGPGTPAGPVGQGRFVLDPTEDDEDDAFYPVSLSVLCVTDSAVLALLCVS